MPSRNQRSGNSDKNQYSAYKNRYTENRKKRLNRHLKKHPNDQQAQNADPNRYRRKTPQSKNGWMPRIWFDKEVEDSRNHALIGAGPKEKKKIAENFLMADKIHRMLENGTISLPYNKQESAHEFEGEHQASVAGQKT